jgi:hypothetical protein
MLQSGPGGRLTLLRALIVAALVSACTPTLRKVETEHLAQLTNGSDASPNRQVGISGTDLGIGFVGAAGQFVLLFGDSWTPDSYFRDFDTVATLIPLPPQPGGPQILEWIRGPDGAQPLRVPGLDLGGMNVPTGGIAANGVNYIFMSTGYDGKTGRHCCSLLVHTLGAALDIGSLALDHHVRSDRFINISAVRWNGLIYLFGSGAYRKSAVYLARTSEAQLGKRDAWEYFAGTDSTGAPVFAAGETNAAELFSSECVGELSVRWHTELGFLMMYNCGPPSALPGDIPAGVHLRRADAPWGRWEPAINIFDPWQDRGYGHFIHIRLGSDFKGGERPYDDGLAEPGVHGGPDDSACAGYGWRERCGAGPYGPYFVPVPRWYTATEDGGFEIYYLLSSWVPYQVHLMRTVLARSDDRRPQMRQRQISLYPKTRLENGDFGSGDLNGWTSEGDPFVVVLNRDSLPRVTSFTPEKGSAARGRLSQSFRVDPLMKALTFDVYGGDGAVKLTHPRRGTLRMTRGRSGNPPALEPESVACWNLEEYAGEDLTIEIVDDVSGPWGFVGAGGFRFLDAPCESVDPQSFFRVSPLASSRPAH